MPLWGAVLWLSFTSPACRLSQVPELDDKNLIAGQLWEKGQAAMREGKADEAIDFYHRSLATDARMVCNHLSLAAAYLERHEDKKACDHLGRYLATRPTQLAIRSRYAELLIRTNEPARARAELERM